MDLYGNVKYSKNFWIDDFYKKNSVTTERSTFADFCKNHIKKEHKILDVACGNGRDSNFFVQNGCIVYSFDSSKSINSNFSGVNFKTLNMEDEIIGFGYPDNFFDIVYCRFVLHAVPEEIEDTILFNANICLKKDGKFLIETRSDKGTVSDKIHNHYRRLINMNSILTKLKNLGFEIEYQNESNGISVYNDEDPILIRIIARKTEDVVIDLPEKFLQIRNDNKKLNPIDCEYLLKSVKKILDCKGIPSFLIFGTLLGAYRDGKFIEHDKDVDLGLTIDRKREISKMIKNGSFSVYGIKMIREYTELISLSYNDQYLDLYFFREEEDFYRCDAYVLDKKDIQDGFTEIEFLGTKFNTVNNIERYLSFHYGEDWKTPIPNKHASF